jgi:hypothetical protein
MAIINSYTTITPKSSDLVLIVDTSVEGNPTKTATVGNLQGTPDNNQVFFDTVGITIQTGASSDSRFGKTTGRTDGFFPTNLRYTIFQADFENLVLEQGSTYKLIMERWKKGGDRFGTTPTDYRYTGFKRQSLAGVDAPYSQRPVQIEITSTTGQFFDFRPDLYFSAAQAAGTTRGFPRPSGFKVRGGTVMPLTSTQYVAFRISKTTNGVTEVSQVLKKLKLKGSYIGGDARAFFLPY